MIRLLAVLTAVACSLPACKRGGAPDGPLRLGYFPNVTHAHALVGTSQAKFAEALGGPASSPSASSTRGRPPWRRCSRATSR